MSKRKPPEFISSDSPEFHGDRLPLSLRTWVPTKGPKDARGQKKEPKPRKVIKRGYGEALTFVFDTETTTDMAQQLRFGVWFLYRHDELASTTVAFYVSGASAGRRPDGRVARVTK